MLSKIRALGRRRNMPPEPAGNVVPGQRVQIEGAGEVCVVLRVDNQRHLADLLYLGGAVRKVEMGIPLALLTSVDAPPATNEMKISA
jgi:hypothetical protein